MIFIVTVTVNWDKNNSKNKVYIQTIEIKIDRDNLSLTSASNLATAFSIMKNMTKFYTHTTEFGKGDNIQQSYAKRNLGVYFLITMGNSHC